MGQKCSNLVPISLDIWNSMKFQLLQNESLEKTTNSKIFCNNSSKMWFQTNIWDISFVYIKQVGISCSFHYTCEIVWNSNCFEINWKSQKITKLTIICNKSSKIRFQTNICDISFIYIKIVVICCSFHYTYEIVWNSNYFEINYKSWKKKTTKSSIICNIRVQKCT
jgi:hypothetical protein